MSKKKRLYEIFFSPFFFLCLYFLVLFFRKFCSFLMGTMALVTPLFREGYGQVCVGCNQHIEDFPFILFYYINILSWHSSYFIFGILIVLSFSSFSLRLWKIVFLLWVSRKVSIFFSFLNCFGCLLFCFAGGGLPIRYGLGLKQ